ncbi:hypothetical protein [Pontibacter beigongshangensis]|uniref:hypothetical protein n=1 Tax=Pontibacter beigongshangensis TaxID=2574733 RepID=UPI0016505B3A|nr:hypothetical protein [Pontibacter beigongshangensis]
MRKQIIHPANQEVSPDLQSWLNLAQLAQVEITSEEAAHPVEAAFATTGTTGWRAGQPGEQIIRLVFDVPQDIRQITLLFREQEQERTQELLLRWLPAGSQAYQEVVRQQYNFSPPHTTEEAEDYVVDLRQAKALELKIIPDISGRNAYASLAALRLG